MFYQRISGPGTVWARRRVSSDSIGCPLWPPGISSNHTIALLKIDTLPETNIAHENPIFPCKYHQNGGFSMAMLVSGRVIFWHCNICDMLIPAQYFLCHWILPNLIMQYYLYMFTIKRLCTKNLIVQIMYKEYRCLKHCNSYACTPLKTHLEPENRPLQEEIPFRNHHFQVYLPFFYTIGWI